MAQEEVWPRKTPAQQHCERQEANLELFTTIAKGQSTGVHDARQSGASTVTRTDHARSTAQHACVNFIPGMYTGRSQRSPSSELAPHQQQRIEDEETLVQLRRYNAYKRGKGTAWHWLLDCLPNHTSEPPKPDYGRLFALAQRAFPARMDLPVLVCDIKKECDDEQERREPFTDTVGNIERRS